MSTTPAKKVSQNTLPTKTVKPAAEKVNQDPESLIKKLQTKTDAINANNVARIANSQLSSADDELHPLMSLKTNRPIEKFPETAKALAKMNVIQITSVLHTLEADSSGKEDEKREKLRLQIGLNPNPA